jgi:hypothetical protein
VAADIEHWTFQNVSTMEPAIQIQSIDHAVKLFLEVSRKDMGECIDYLHFHRGSISCIAGRGLATISFIPEYNKSAHSLVGSRRLKSKSGKVALPFVDSLGVAGFVPPFSLRRAAKVGRAIAYILEYHDVPSFLDWSQPAQEM